MKAVVCFILVMACSSCATSHVSRWSPDVSNFDAFIEVRPDPEFVAIRDRVVALYALVRARDWSSVYDFRTSEFRAVVDRDTFVQTIGTVLFQFDGYKVLASGLYRAGPERQKWRLIMKFDQGGLITYEVVWWRLENGVWYVENLGLNGLSFTEPLMEETL
jgi:hypothetical protein